MPDYACYNLPGTFHQHSYSLANEISSLLEVSLDSAYRRLRGETDLSLNEVVKLCHHFDVPLETLNNEMPGVVTFRFNNKLDDVQSFTRYLQNILSDLEAMLKFENKRLYFAAEDVPVFYQFSHPSLLRFKIFYWMKSIVSDPSFQLPNYKAGAVSDELISIAEDIYKAYQKIPTTEIWTEETIVSNLKQVRFYWDAGIFSAAKDALQIVEEAEEMIRVLQRQCESGRKISPSGSVTPVDYVFYHSDLMIGTNNVLVKTEGHSSSYISYNSFNSMSTGNRFFNEQNERWMNNLISKSTLLSSVAEKQRNQFFKGMYRKLEELKVHLSA
jgi:hypothetical protein